jgi:hypothetical protein
MDALTAAAQATLASAAKNLPTATLAVGDHYLDSAGQVAQATTTLRLEAQVRLDTAAGSSYDGIACIPLCTASALMPIDGPAGGWPVLAAVTLGLRFTTAAGQEILAPDSTSQLGASPITMIPLFTRWQDGVWQTPTVEVDDGPEIDPAICPAGGNALDALRATPGVTKVDQSFQTPYRVPTAELGCLFADSETNPTTGESTSPIALVLYRAGALVAANSEAHRAFPTLPVASAHERALAQAVAPSSL